MFEKILFSAILIFTVPRTNGQPLRTDRHSNADDTASDSETRPGMVGLRFDAADPMTVIAIVPGSPASQAGITVGDKLKTVDGQPADSWTLAQISAHLGGVAGSEVTATFQRGDDPPMNYRLIRRALTARVPDGFPPVIISALKGRNGKINCDSPVYKGRPQAQAECLSTNGRKEVASKTAALAARITAARFKAYGETYGTKRGHVIEFEVKIKNLSEKTFAWLPLFFNFYDSTGKLLGDSAVNAYGKSIGDRQFEWKPGYIQTVSATLDIPKGGFEVSQYEVLFPGSAYVPLDFPARGVFAMDSVPVISDDSPTR